MAENIFTSTAAEIADEMTKSCGDQLQRLMAAARSLWPEQEALEATITAMMGLYIDQSRIIVSVGDPDCLKNPAAREVLFDALRTSLETAIQDYARSELN